MKIKLKPFARLPHQMLIKVIVLKKYYLEKLTVYKCAVRNWWTTDDVERTASSSCESFSATDLNQQVRTRRAGWLLAVQLEFNP